MYKTLYESELDKDTLKSLSKSILVESLKYDNHYIGVRIIYKDKKEMSISRKSLNLYSVIIRNQLGNKINEFEFNNLESYNFDFI